MRVLRYVLVGLACAAIATPALAQRDHVLCYKVKQSKGFDAFGKTDATKKVYGAIDDILDPNNIQELDPSSVTGVATTAQIKKVKDLCVPADKNAEGITDADTHWVMYQIKSQKGSCSADPAVPCKKDDDCLVSEGGPGGTCDSIDKFDKKASPQLSTRVKDQFTDIRLDFAKEAMLMIPASLDAGSFQGDPGGEHYKCYSVKPTKASCVGGTNDGEACKDSTNCAGGGACVKNLKFPKETHPDGLSASIEDSFQADQDPSDPPKTFDLKKIKMFCQSADKKLLGVPVEPRLEEQAGLLCYQAKLAGGKCAADSPVNALGSCKAEETCGGEKKVTTYCQKKADPKFDKKDPDTLARYVEDQMFQHRLDVAKEDLFCIPACRGFQDFVSSGLSAHVSSLAIETAPDVGVNVDGLTTCRPTGCTPALGVDNALAGLGSIVNSLLQEQLDTQSINLVFEADALNPVASYTALISGFTGELDATPGCSVGSDPGDLPIDPADPNDPCNYIVSTAADLTGSCADGGLLSMPVTVTGADTTPSATAEGGGAGSDFTFSLPFGEVPIAVTAENVVVQADITHDGSDIEQISGHLGGGVNHALLVSTVAGLDNVCVGGANDELPCDPNAPDCPGGSCALSADIPFSSTGLSSFIALAFPPDLDLDPADDPGSNPSCTECESVSLNLAFSAERAEITGSVSE